MQESYLYESLNQYRSEQTSDEYIDLIDHLPVGFAHHQIICDEQGRPADYRFVSINERFEYFTGLKASNLVGKTVLEVLPDTEKYWIDYYGKVALTREPVEFDNYSQTLDKHFSVYAFSPKLGEFTVLFVDVTNAKLVETSLKANEDKFNAILDSAPIAIVAVIDGKISYINQHFAEIFKFLSISDSEGVLLSNLFTEKTFKDLSANLNSDTTSDSSEKAITGIGIRIDKTEFPVVVYQRTLKLKDNQTQILFVSDLTASQNTEAQLRFQSEELSAQYEELQATTEELEASSQELENNHRILLEMHTKLKDSEEKLSLALEGADLGLWVYDIELGLFSSNDRFYQLLGYLPNEVVITSTTFREHVYKADLNSFDSEWLLVLTGQRSKIDLVIRMLTKTGELKWIRIRGKVVNRSADSLPLILSGVNSDVTEEKLLQDKLFESEYKYRTIFDAEANFMFFLDGETLVITDVNQAALQAFGYTREELIGKKISVISPIPGDCALEKAATENQNYIAYAQSLTKDRTIIDVEVVIDRLQLKQRPYYIYSIRNITYRLAVEKKIFQSEEQYRSLVNKLPIGIYRSTVQGEIIYSNYALMRILEIDEKSKHPKLNVNDFFVDYHFRTNEIFSWMKSKKVTTSEYQLKTAKGNRIWVRDTGKAVFDEDGSFKHFDGILEDITENKVQEYYLEQNLKLHELVASIATEFINIQPEYVDSVIEKTLERIGRFSKAEHAILFLIDEQLGASKKVYDWKDAEKNTWFHDFTVTPLTLFPSYLERLSRGEVIHTSKIEDLECTEQEREWILNKGFKGVLFVPIILNNELGGILGYIGRKNYDDVWTTHDKNILQLIAPVLLSALQHKREQIARLESEQRFKAIFDNSGDAMLLLSDVIEECNQACLELFKCSKDELIGKEVYDYSPERQPSGIASRELGSSYIDKALKEISHTFYWQHLAKNGQLIDTEVRLSRIYYKEKAILHAAIRDITLRKRDEDNRILVAKLQSLGSLAGGLAHDFNNLLTAIFGNIQLASMENDIEEVKKRLATNEPILERAVGLTRQLLTFSKGGEPNRKTVSIKEIIERNVKFFMSGSKAGLDIVVDPDLWTASIDQDQIGQVLQNLISNAREAMNDEGKIRIIADNYTEDEQKFIRVKISDTGPGINQDVILRIFDPYFTTKSTGSGLGLSICRSIISKHEGKLIVESALGKGSTFTILLPTTKQSSTLEISKEKRHLVNSDKKFKILILDDEPVILTLLTRLLEKQGHTVKSSTDGKITLDLYKQALDTSNPFDIVILDLTIPGGMGGKQTMQELIKIDPNVCAVVSSGYSEDPVVAKYSDYGFKASLSKPYRMTELSKVINSLL